MTTKSSQKIAYVSSALSPEDRTDRESFDFFSLLLTGIAQRIHRAEHEVAIYVPRKINADDSDQKALLEDVLRRATEYACIIVAPFKTGDVGSALVATYERMGKNASSPNLPPIICIDKALIPTQWQTVIPKDKVPLGVVCDNHRGGELAAQLLFSALKQSYPDMNHWRILILPGLEGGEQRRDGCASHLKSLGIPEQNITILTDHRLNFTRTNAERWAAEQLKNALDGSPNAFGNMKDDLAWGIFACNDEMALGIRNVVASLYTQERQELARIATHNDRKMLNLGMLEKQGEKVGFLQSIQIVGFDGIGAVRDLLIPPDGLDPDPWLVGTIDARIDLQTEDAVGILRKLLNGQLPDKNPHLIPVREIRRRGL